MIRDIGTYLVAQGLANGISTDVFLDTRPDNPDDVISIFEYPGPPTTIQDDISRRVQIMVRNKSYASARAKAWAIFNLLDRPDDRIITVNGRRGWFKALQQPNKLDIDANNRVIFVFNLEVLTSRD